MQFADEDDMKTAHPQGTGYEANYVEFRNQPIKDDAASDTEGRAIFKPCEFCKIRIPGDKTLVVDRPATEEDKQNYPRQYRAFKEARSQDEASGTLLSAWSGVTAERCEEYRALKVMTVEQLAGMQDGHLANFGHGTRQERERAIDFVKTMKGYAPTAQIRKELETANAQLEVMQRQMNEQKAAIDELRRGRQVDSAFAAVAGLPDSLGLSTGQATNQKRK